ncbi:cob(I)yrinic acid a,c-diamide adenosyltransferase [Novosphingobium pentaromativorans]|uniref:Corrinoid adenosyltransferase n=1 Tax=Novosphingobium pentaromativorans US6-1 TaxID=1088721 RepID=G6EIV0_9SPHN|nr:cob(I)yrinic acid a,c-diamide adenosyltransferase [Novosphingobium pentaromativorans]EHJ58709.1 cob(I)alamin adenosyltransferase [Novosphingobium pentaromativorans US6-1]
MNARLAGLSFAPPHATHERGQTVMTDTENLTEEDRRHKERTRKLKSLVDARIAAARIDKGLVLVLTGNGKGKSSSAFGMVARTLGYGRTAAVFQFIKSKVDVGERAFLSVQPGVTWENCGEGFTWETQNRQRDIAAAQAGWTKAKAALADPEISLVVLDELTYLINYGYLTLEEVLPAIRNRPEMQHVVITGRAAHAEFIELADTVSRIGDEKHAFRNGIKAQPGIDL